MSFAFNDISTDPVTLLTAPGIEAFILRLDKVHPVISGNKWFKLQYYLKEAKEQDKKRIVTFGGAWSNHIVATAAACQMMQLASAGIIRGEEPGSYSPALLQAKKYGMQLHFISREEYAEKKLPATLMNDKDYLVAEGGFGQPGVKGAATILDYTTQDFTHCCCAVGTGTMMAGLTGAITAGQQLIGISVLKNNYQLNESVRSLVPDETKKWQIIHDYHFGGYAKHQPALINFMNECYRQTGIPTDFVYTGKLFYAVNDLAQKGFFPRGSRLLLIHSGGLQGNNSLEKGTLIF